MNMTDRHGQTQAGDVQEEIMTHIGLDKCFLNRLTTFLYLFLQSKNDDLNFFSLSSLSFLTFSLLHFLKFIIFP